MSSIRIGVPWRVLSVAWLTFFAAVLSPCVVRAQSAKEGVVVYLEGADAEATRSEIVQALSEETKSLDPAPFSAALSQRGYEGRLAKVLGSKKGKERNRLLLALRDSTKEAEAQGAVVGYLKRSKAGGHEVVLWMIAPSGNEPPAELAVAFAKKDKAKDRVKRLRASLQGPVQRLTGAPPAKAAPVAPPEETAKATKPAAPPPPEPEAAKAVPEEPASSEEKEKTETKAKESTAVSTADGYTRPIVELGVLLELTQRRYRYNEQITNNLRPYDVTGAPLIKFAVELYPFAKTMAPVLQDFGIVGHYGHSVGLSSQLPNGQSITTSWSVSQIGARERFYLGKAEKAGELGVDITYAHWVFDFPNAGASSADLPSAGYNGPRVGADLRWPAGGFSVLGGLGYRFVSSQDPLTNRFPHAHTGGVDAHIGALFPIVDGLKGTLVFEYNRFFSTFHPLRNDAHIAGGALDQYFGLNFGITFIH